jgi:hypothetical protein
MILQAERSGPSCDVIVPGAGAAVTAACFVSDDGHDIRGMYACGDQVRSIMGGAHHGPGVTICPATAFACHATRQALQERTA